MRTLTERELNRALLARQLLLERSALSIPAALEQLAGIQNQYAPNAYIRLWSCRAGFRRVDLDAAYDSGAVVQGTLMRGTIHTISAADYHPFVAGIRGPLRDWARRVTRGDDSGRDAVLRRVRQALAGRTVRRPDLVAMLADADPAVRQTIDIDLELLRVPPSGTWQRRRADLCRLADEVLGGHEEIGQRAGLEHLVRRYLAGFGPAGLRDIADFTGVPPAALKPVVETMDLIRYADEAGRPLFDTAGAPLPDADTPAPARYLPTWDAVLLVHARRTGVLPEQYRPLIFHTKMPPSYPTFLVDGRVAGTWRYDAERGELDLAPFAPLASAVTVELEAEAIGLAELHR